MELRNNLWFINRFLCNIVEMWVVSAKSKVVDREILDKVSKNIMTRNKLVFDRLAEI